MVEIIQYLVDGSLPEDRVKAQLLVEHSKHFLLFNEVLYYDNREKLDDVGPDYDLRPMRIAVSEHLRKQILHEAHGTDFSGHFGISKVYKKLKRWYWWPNLRGDVKKHIHASMQCAV